MTQKEKARAYDEALKLARDYHEDKNCFEYLKGVLEHIFPELKESDDKVIKKALLNYLTKMWGNGQDDVCGVHVEDVIDWVERKDEQEEPQVYETENSEVITYSESEVYNRIDSSEILYVYDIRDGRYYFNDMWHFSWSVKECDENCHLWTIQDARSGDVLASNNSIFIFNREYAAGKPEAYCGIINDEFIDNAEGCWTNEKYYPATKEQRELLFKKMIEAGYVWDENEKELRKIEQKPVNKMIEPKFKVGDWITNGFDCTFQIASIENGIYYDTNNCGSDIESTDKYYRLWTLEDAKNGDVLYFSDETIVIFKDLYNATTFHSYCHIEDSVFDISKDDMPDWWEGAGFHPATKEQRELLFKKMKEAGYEWNAEKKELKKIDEDGVEYKKHIMSELVNLATDYVKQKSEPAWSEEDEKNWQGIIDEIQANKNSAPCYDLETYDRYLNWIESIKQRLGGGK